MASSVSGQDVPVPVKLHCADALDTEYTPAQEMERAKVVMQASPRMPAVAFFGSRYGERWYIDMVAFPHNAVRRQLYDAFLIANALGKMTLDVPEGDLARVYAWLGSLERFVDATLYAEDRFLYPLVDAQCKKRSISLPEMLTSQGRSSAKQQIRELLSDARKTRDVATGEITAKINALRYALDQFGANILDYYNATEKFLPNLLKSTLRNGEKEKEKIERRTLDQMMNEPYGATLAALLMQCIESRSKRAEFIARHFKKDKHKESFKLQVKKVQSTHMILARTFDEVATKYERRFSVNTFLQYYGSNMDGDDSLMMIGDVDLNDEDDVPVPAPPQPPLALDDPSAPETVLEDHVLKTVSATEDDAPKLQLLE